MASLSSRVVQAQLSALSHVIISAWSSSNGLRSEPGGRGPIGVTLSMGVTASGEDRGKIPFSHLRLLSVVEGEAPIGVDAPVDAAIFVSFRRRRQEKSSMLNLITGIP
jgi:hypothetical protein